MVSFTSFLPLFLAAVYMYYYEDVDPLLKPKDTHPEDLLDEYDFIIVGAGSAGCVLANRLSEIKDWKILLLESGGDENAVTDTPFLYNHLFHTEYTWNYTTVQQKKACGELNGICEYPRGKVLGGSSTVNAMLYARGNKEDYNEWSRMGNLGWSYSDIVEYFIKSENATNLPKGALRGYNGPLNIQYANFHTPMRDAFLKAGKELGWKEIDYNGVHQIGIGITQLTVKGPSRGSASKSYLNPIRNRKNLHISKHSDVQKILTKGSIATGIEFKRDEEMYTVNAKQEIILSAGSIDSPKLLMLSGIGPKDHLESLGIPVIADLPVGLNLQDHLITRIVVKMNQDSTEIPKALSNESIINYAKNRKGPLSTPGYEIMAFANVTNPYSEIPDTQIIFQVGNNVDNVDNVAMFVCNLKPKSIGTIRLNSSSPDDTPLIDPNYLNENIDYQASLKGIQLAFDFLKTPSMASYNPKLDFEYLKLCQNITEINNCLLQNYSRTSFHPVGTTKMGPETDTSSVVNPQLIVKGFRNLRVVDASVMPTIPRGNTNGPTIMIAEKAADAIIKDRNILEVSESGFIEFFITRLSLFFVTVNDK